MVLPQSLCENLSPQQVDLIIRHELIHLKHYDSLVVILTHLLNCFTWFNPFINIFQKNINWAIEANCDLEVLSQKPHLRKTYAQTVLKVLRQSATVTSNHMVAAFSTKTHRNLTMRIMNIMKPQHADVKLKLKKSKLWVGVISASCLIFIAQPQLLASTNNKSQAMIKPIKTTSVSSPYGASNKRQQLHKGIDLKAKMNTPIVSISTGVVRVSTDHLKNRKNYGTIIIIDHADGFHSVYAHLNDRQVSAGDVVKAGQLIGHVGKTGKATGPHLHLEILKNNKHIDPSHYINF